MYLAALERARRDTAFAFTNSSLIDDTPTTFVFDRRRWRPANYGDVYDGPVTARMALARSRNVAAVKVARQTGFQDVADLWAAASGGAAPPAYPSLALGVFEATPLQVAQAYTVLANGGVRMPLRAITRVTNRDRVIELASEAARRVVATDSAYLVTQMLESVLDAGTAAAARRQGFRHDAAGKTGSTDDLRDAWFAGFTPTLLTVVWVGVDDDSPLGLTGAQAALPVWTDFMRRALDGRESPISADHPGSPWSTWTLRQGFGRHRGVQTRFRSRFDTEASRLRCARCTEANRTHPTRRRWAVDSGLWALKVAVPGSPALRPACPNRAVA